jgi:hypothetical protein
MKRFWQLSIIISLGFALVANGLVGAQLLGLPAINDVSDTYATYLTPAGYAFAIWSLIFALLIVFAVYQARDFFTPQKSNDLPQKAGPLFVVSSICNGLWTYIFVSEYIALSVVVIVTLAASLYGLLYKLRIATTNPPFIVIFCVWWPLLIYTGWVTIASVVNISSWVASLGVSVTPVAAVVTLLIVAAFLVALLIRRNTRELLLSSAWGIAAIGANQAGDSGSTLVSLTAFAVAGVLIIAAGIHAFQHRKTLPTLSKAV